MAEHQPQPGELALLKAVRNLDQGGSDAIPDKLDHIWKILSIPSGGKFHAAEEVIVRWLLKNMNGSSQDAEKLRRYPLAWRILGRLFSSIPLFSLAKSLADRRFVVVLQSTLKDASEPKGETEQGKSSDAEMADAGSDEVARPRKRKRADSVQFDLESESAASGCLRTAESLFTAVRILLARLESKAPRGSSGETHMGAEHIKSLFCSSASDIKDVIAPALRICQLAITIRDLDEFEGQEAWISTICDIWDLHLQGEEDPLQVATHFGPFAIYMLGRLASIPDARYAKPHDEISRQWSQDLSHFLSRNLILPAKSVFLNKGDLEIIRVTLENTAGFSTVACAVLFHLAASSPHLANGQRQRDNDSWIQALFSLLDETLQSSRSSRRLAAVTHMVRSIRDHNIALSLETFRSICRNYALQPGRPEWALVRALASLNADVFIVGEGQDLLQAVFDQMAVDEQRDPVDIDAQNLKNADHDKREIVRTIAAGFAAARDLSRFVKIWFQHLAAIEAHIGLETRQCQIWYNFELCATVAQSLEKTMNIKQILSLLDWLDSQADEPTENATLILLLNAISLGITQDDVADSVGPRLFNMAFKRSLPSSVSSEVLASKWAVARRSLDWATLEQGQDIWASSVSQLGDVLRKSPLSDSYVVDAFKFAAAGWVANHPGGQYEDAAAELTLSFISRLDEESLDGSDTTVQKRVIGHLIADNKRWHYRDACPRLLSMIIERGNGRVPKFLKSALSFRTSKDRPLDVGDDFKDSESGEVFQRVSALLGNENNTNSNATMSVLLNLICDGLREAYPGKTFACAAESLLIIPLEAISREHREGLMAVLVPAIASCAREGRYGDIGVLKPILSLMVKLMKKPTYYMNMAFSDLDSLAETFGRASWKSLQCLPLVEELAALTMRQMTANVEAREENYFRLAVSDMEKQCRSNISEPDEVTVFRVLLLKTLILTITDCPGLKRVGDLDVNELGHHLTEMVEAAVEHFSSRWEEAPARYLTSASIILREVHDLYQRRAADESSRKLKEVLTSYLPRLSDASERLGPRDDDIYNVWDLRTFLAKNFSNNNEASQNLGHITVGKAPNYRWSYLEDPSFGNRDGILEYVDAVMADADDSIRLANIKAFLLPHPDAPIPAAQLLTIYRIIQQLQGNTPSLNESAAENAPETFDLAAVHTILCKRLRSSEDGVEFVLITKVLETILDKRESMTQWNIELTLSTVSVLASQASTHRAISGTPKAYECMCRLVQTILRQHRLRLEGHFHILVIALQSLLRALVGHRFQDASDDKLVKRARSYARLLTMVCEPTPGSVARSQQTSLDSATDAAKRYAGQHMYLVLMLYIKLQLEQNVPHRVREALEPGVFAIFDITTPDCRRIMNDALDGSGRAIMKELYKQYLKFGKWSGI